MPFRVLNKQYTFTNSKESKTTDSENKIIHGDNLEPLQHTGIPLRTKRFQVFNVSPDSIKYYLNNPLIEMQLQCTQEMYYYEGAVLKSGKAITKDYTEGFDFYIEQPDQSETMLEIEDLKAEINQTNTEFQNELNALWAEK